MKEALDWNADLIISYHPPIFAPLKRITQRYYLLLNAQKSWLNLLSVIFFFIFKNSNWKERIVSQLLENNIALYSPHTAWDSINGGVNDWLSKSFAFSSIRPILPNESLLGEKYKNAGAGRILQLTDNVSLRLAIDLIKKHTGLENVHVSIGVNNTMDSSIKTVALCAGSGSSVLKSIDADLYLTGIINFTFVYLHINICGKYLVMVGFSKELKELQIYVFYTFWKFLKLLEKKKI